MYAILMNKTILSNDIILYNPITLIEGRIDKKYHLFNTKESRDFYSATDSNFILSELTECYAYPITKEELLKKYPTKSLQEAKIKYQNEIFSNFNFGLGSLDDTSFNIFKLPVGELMELLTAPSLSTTYYNGSITIPKKQLYMLTQLKNEKTLKKFIDQNQRRIAALKKSESQKQETTNHPQSQKVKPVNVITKEKEIVNPNIRRDIDSEELESYLKDNIKGQDEQIETLVTVISDNYKTKNRYLIQRPLLLGPSGSGKTETLMLLADYLKVPFTKYSTPTLSATGYVGKDIDDLLQAAYKNSKNNLSLCGESLVFLDEFDKIAMCGNEVSDKSVQNLLLNFLDGMVYEVPLSTSGVKTVKIDTTFMNIVVGGAFSELLTQKEKNMGFIIDKKKNQQLTDKDIVSYGFTREIVGRLNPKILYNQLTDADLETILLNSKLSPLKLKQQFYQEVYNTNLLYTKDYVKSIITKTREDETGARALKQIVFSSLYDVSRTLQQKSNRNKYKEVIVDKQTVDNPKVYTLRKK